MGAVKSGVALMRQSWAVLKADKELVLFPIFSAVAGILVLASFALPIALTVPWDQLDKKASAGPIQVKDINPYYYAAIFSFYVVNFTVMNFFNSALAACVLERFRGGNPTISFGLKAASARLHHIVGWALLSATVGMVIKMIQERVGLVGKLITGLIGVAWTVASYFAVPVLVAENVGPIDALKRSGQLMTKTWGASLVSNMGMGLVGFGLGLLTVIPLLGGITLCILAGADPKLNAVMLGLGLACVGLSFILMLALGLVMTTMKAILNTALYHFAVEGQAPAGFDNDLMQQAFRTKKKK